jgi:DNA-binding CsgD family transcriptional regulator
VSSDGRRGLGEWPLVGRSAVLAELRDLLTGPAPRGVVLAGPPGVGRTAIGRACLQLAQKDGVATAHVTGTRAAADVPFGAVAPLLPAATRRATGDDRLELLRSAVAALAQRDEERRLVLLVDDAHLLDEGSATLVHQVATTGAAVVLATVRAGGSAPDPVVALWRDGVCARVEIDGLGTDETGELLRTVLGGPVDPAVVAHMAERCRGNVLFLRELVSGAVDDGSLRDDGGVWRLDGDLVPSARLVEVVEADLGGLDDDERALLEVVALGEPVDVAELEPLSAPSVIEGLERRGVLAGRIDGDRLRVELVQPLVGDVVRARTPAVRARTIAEALAGAVARRGPDDAEDVLRLATWGLSAGEADPEVLLRGAAIARDRSDLPLAEALARAAADAGAGFEAVLLAAQAAARQGRVDEADATLAALAAQAADDGERNRAALARVDASLASGGGADVLRDVATSVRDPVWRDRLAARELALVLLADGPAAALGAARPLLAHGDGETLAFARLVAADALARTGRVDEALAVAHQGVEATADREDEDVATWSPVSQAATRAAALVHAGRFAEAEALAADHHERALADGAVDRQAVFAVLEPAAVADRGRVRTAARRAREALVVHRRLGRLVLVRRDLVASAMAHALAGDAAAAASDLDELDALDLPPVRRDEADLLQARAWAAAAAGDLPGACAHLDEAAARGEKSGDHVGAAAALHSLARLGRAPEASDRLAAIAARIAGELAPARMAHVRALAAGDAAALDSVADRFDELGADLLAAEAAADAAVAYRRSGDRRGAAGAARSAGDLAARAEEPVTPALQAVETRAVLTPAERETAALAASGRANKEIAEQLHLSPRTVENRLQRVYDKLGVSGRGELAEALAPTG